MGNGWELLSMTANSHHIDSRALPSTLNLFKVFIKALKGLSSNYCSPSFDSARESWTKLSSTEYSHSTLIQLSSSFDRVHQSWTKLSNLVTQLSYNSHPRLTARVRAEQSSHPNLVTQLSYNSRPRLTARMRAKQNSRPNQVTQLSYNFHPRLTMHMRTEQNSHPNLVTQLLFHLTRSAAGLGRGLR